MNDDMATRLRQARKRRGFGTVKAAASALGMPYSTVAGHERTGNVRRDELIRYAKFYRVSIDWLLYGKENSSLTKKPENFSFGVPVLEVPLFTIADISAFIQISKGESPFSGVTTVIAASPETPKRLIGVRIKDKSMVQAAMPSLAPGYIVYIDPDTQPEPGDIGLAVLKGEREGLIRRVGHVIENGIMKVVLQPFNPAYATLTFVPDDYSFILGRARHLMVDI